MTGSLINTDETPYVSQWVINRNWNYKLERFREVTKIPHCAVLINKYKIQMYRVHIGDSCEFHVWHMFFNLQSHLDNIYWLSPLYKMILVLGTEPFHWAPDPRTTIHRMVTAGFAPAWSELQGSYWQSCWRSSGSLTQRLTHALDLNDKSGKGGCEGPPLALPFYTVHCVYSLSTLVCTPSMGKDPVTIN